MEHISEPAAPWPMLPCHHPFLEDPGSHGAMAWPHKSHSSWCNLRLHHRKHGHRGDSSWYFKRSKVIKHLHQEQKYEWQAAPWSHNQGLHVVLWETLQEAVWLNLDPAYLICMWGTYALKSKSKSNQTLWQEETISWFYMSFQNCSCSRGIHTLETHKHRCPVWLQWGGGPSVYQLLWQYHAHQYDKWASLWVCVTAAAHHEHQKISVDWKRLCQLQSITLLPSQNLVSFSLKRSWPSWNETKCCNITTNIGDWAHLGDTSSHHKSPFHFLNQMWRWLSSSFSKKSCSFRFWWLSVYTQHTCLSTLKLSVFFVPSILDVAE